MSLLTSVTGAAAHAYSPSALDPEAGVRTFEASQGYTARICHTKEKISNNKYFFKGRKDKRNRRKGILSKANR